MVSRKVLEKNFKLTEWDPVKILDSDTIAMLVKKYDNSDRDLLDIPKMPMQVHEILIHHGRIEDPAVTGSGEGCRWVSDRDWIYIARIREDATGADIRLKLGGLDVIADIYWNGNLEKQCRDVFLPVEIDLTGKVRGKDVLLIHFHSPCKYLESITMPERYTHKVMSKHALIRGSFRSFCDYLGYKPYLTKMGVYDSIILEDGESYMKGYEIGVSVSEDLQQGFITANVTCMGINNRSGYRIQCTLFDEDKLVARESYPVVNGGTTGTLKVSAPKLWWTKELGQPFLYSLEIKLSGNENEQDIIQKKIGFRNIKKVGDFDFCLNGHPLKIWGANLAPIDNKTTCYNKTRSEKILRIALEAHMNCLRVWGGGDRLPDEFYEKCDESGILLWQDFFHDYSMYPEEDGFRELCRQEVRYQVGRLKYHPSILLWCGSNESVMCRDFSNPGEECTGFAIYDEDYRRICNELDKDRYYCLSSPFGGDYANDPLHGDTHSYTSTWFVPGGRYPVFLSENMRSFPPVYRSLKRMLDKNSNVSQEQTSSANNPWPDNYTGQMLKGNLFPWPETWKPYTSAESWKKISEVEQYYDANDAESMIYRFGASVAAYITNCVGRYRRGRSFEERFENIRKCKGHLWWKMNTSAPHIYSGLLDYYLETYIPYYAMKRAYQPFQLFYSVDDYIGLWAVNDTLKTIKGTIYVKLFNIKKNVSVQFFDLTFSCEPDQSLFLTDLNCFKQFLKNENVLYAKAIDESGNLLTEIIDFADIERHMEFPECTLNLSWNKDQLIIETDRFARCIEIIGNDGVDEFGWEFSDNYFDMIPGQIKKIQVSGQHIKGIIRAKAYYSGSITEISYKK